MNFLFRSAPREFRYTLLCVLVSVYLCRFIGTSVVNSIILIDGISLIKGASRTFGVENFLPLCAHNYDPSSIFDDGGEIKRQNYENRFDYLFSFAYWRAPAPAKRAFAAGTRQK